MPEPERFRTEGMDSTAGLGDKWVGGRALVKGDDKTAIAELDSCGGSEAARLAAAEGDMRDCCGCQAPIACACDTSERPGSTAEMGMVLPEACIEGAAAAEGACIEEAAAAKGEDAGEACSAASCLGCWEGLPAADAPGMLNCLGRLPAGSEPYAERGELALSMGNGGRRWPLPFPLTMSKESLPRGEGASILGWYSSSASLLRKAAVADGEISPDLLGSWSPDTCLTAS